MKRISLADIANELGVSRTLVSMVLNHRGDENGISKETQEKVWQKARELNYQPNRMARGLRLGRSNTIGLIVADISNSFYGRIARSVEDAAIRKGYHILVASSDEKEERETALMQMLIGRQVDGLIIASTMTDFKGFDALKQQGIPFVLIDRYFPQMDANYVIVDNSRAAQNMVAHLLKQNYRKIGLLTIAPGHISTMKDRVEGYKVALAGAGYPFQAELLREIDFDDAQNSVRKALQSLIADHQVDAIFALNNNLAVASLNVLHEMNLNIPEDIALVSFDDTDLFRYCQPPITAIAQPDTVIGEKAFEVIFNEINQAKNKVAAPREIILPTTINIRMSCGYK